MSNGWFIAFRSPEFLELLREDPKGFCLLSLVAHRARWSEDQCQVTGLGYGQAFIGDFKAAGIETRQAFRLACKRLFKRGFLTIQGTNKGTIATLLPQAIYGMQAPAKEPAQEPTRNHQGTIKEPLNKKERKKEGEKEEPSARSSLVESLWMAAPAKSRNRSSKAEVDSILAKTKSLPNADDLLASLAKWSRCEEWTKDGGQYAPGLHIWIKKRKWESDPAQPEQDLTLEPEEWER